MDEAKRKKISYHKYSSQLQGKIAVFCARNQIEYDKIIGVRAGIMDCILVIDSDVMFVEIKSPHDVESPLQTYRKSIFNREREIAFTVRTFDEFLDALEKFLSTSKILQKKVDKKNRIVYDIKDGQVLGIKP